jgi:gliding motility-associated-like protein
MDFKVYRSLALFPQKQSMKKILLLVFIVLANIVSIAQCGTPGLYCMDNITINACSGNLYDAGGGSQYPDTPFTMTICPDTPGDVIQLDFSAFALQTSPGNGNSDYLSIFDGDNTGANSLGDYSGTSLQGLQVTGTVSNVTGCLTLVFDPNGAANNTFPGFEASISCTTPCAPPTAAAAITNPSPIGAEQTISVCQDVPVSFSAAGSFAEPGFSLAGYIWNFDDGIVDNGTNQNVTHNFTEPGEYVVVCTVEDNNGCQSLNIIPLQVLVSTIPLFPTLEDQETCFGETITVTGAAESTTWTALPPQVVAGTTYLADGAGFSYSTSLEFDFFEPDAVLESCDDLLGVVMNMEHSYMGDLGVFITCPNGTVVSLVEWGVNGGGGTFLGEAIDDAGSDPGIGYTYTWDPQATNGTWGENTGGIGFGGSLPAGSYESFGNMCNLVGCPLNGAWTISVTDNLGADNGYIFYWGVNFNPMLFPDITTFTPSIGADADSSYWTGPHISQIDFNQDVITVDPPAPGSYDYVYHVINSFGCEFDTTITLTFNETLSVTAGPDQTYSCGAVELQGSFVGMPAPSCANDAGNFNYCYPDSDFQVWTYCPDDVGDGTQMSITFNAGQLETCCDFITIYNGDNTGAPIIAAGVTGILDGQTWTASNTSGCITMQFTSDGSVSCGGGFGGYPEWDWTVGCGNGGPQYTWEWTPEEFLDNPTLPTPDVITLPQTTTFTLVGYPVGHPDCESTDQVIVSIDPLGDPGLPNTITICSTDASFNMLPELNGNPVTTGEWTDPAGNVVASGIYDPSSDIPGDYTYTVAFANCSASAVLTIEMALPTVITIPNDTALCFGGDINLDLLNLQNGQSPFSYQWTYNGSTVSGAESLDYQPSATGQACLTVTDGCGYAVTECFNVEVEQPVLVEFEADTTRACWPTPFEFSNLVDPSLFTNSLWDFGDGVTLLNQQNPSHLYEQPGSYDVTLLLTTALGCTYATEYTGYVVSFTPPQAEFYATPQPTNALNTEIEFHDLTIGSIASYEWIFNTSNVMGTSVLQNPIFQFPIGTGGFYPVLLTVIDNNGCTDTYQKIVVIDDIFQYYIPNAFTPNGDGINDVWKLYGADLDPNNFYMQVFNNWGDLVFESKDPELYWTGNFKGGEYFVQDGIYQWRAKVVSKSTGERKEIEGHLYLTR